MAFYIATQKAVKRSSVWRLRLNACFVGNQPNAERKLRMLERVTALCVANPLIISKFIEIIFYVIPS